MGVLAFDKFKPTLFVGLGGNGGKIVNNLAARLKRHPHWDRIQPLTHFLSIDTNKNDLDTLRDVAPDCRFLVSNFDARSYLERKQGKRELPEDHMVTQWFPESYEPRQGMSPGAGQIRIESRLKLYYNLEEDRVGLRRKVMRIFDAMTSRENPWRDNEDRVVRVCVYCSVAGGTGSGGFLPMAFLFRRWVEDNGWGRPDVRAFLSLPTTFLSKVRPELHSDIAANGYAALKELEYLNRQLGYAGGLDELPFNYDPGTADPSRRVVKGRPFSLCYLIDKPAQLAIEKYEHAVSDASYLLLYSHLEGKQAGEYDNYEKHQKMLALGHFASHYGAFGTSVLQLPRNDVLRYASMRFVSKALREYLCFGGEHEEFRVPYGDPAFERLSEDERNRQVDDKFASYVRFRSDEEKARDERGMFTDIHDLVSGGKDLMVAVYEDFEKLYGQLNETIDIPDFNRLDINTGNPTIRPALAHLRRSYGDSRRKVREYLEARLADLRSGRFFKDVFSRYNVNPVAQRLILIRLMEAEFIAPMAPRVSEGDEGEDFAPELEFAFLLDEKPPMDLDNQVIKDEEDRHCQSLAKVADQGFLSKVADRENKAFKSARRRAISFVEGVYDDCREDLRRYFWRSYVNELRNVGEKMLSAYRKVAEISDEEARLTEAETDRFRRDPSAFPDSDVAQFYLDAEVLRDDRRKERLWDRFYTHMLDRSAFFEVKDVFTVVVEGFSPIRDPDGTLRARDAGEIVRFVKDALQTMATGVYTQVFEDMGLDLAKGLDLEQRYIALLDDNFDFEGNRATLDDAVRSVDKARVQRGVEDRLKRLSEECVLLAHIDRSRMDDPTVRAADVSYVGVASAFATDEPDSLWQVLRSVVPGVNQVEGWEERDALVLYRAMLGVPLYFFKNVLSQLEPAYKKVHADPRRTYPLHIEKDWESELPNLDPVEVRRAEEKRAAKASARSAASARANAVKAFSLCTVFGSVVSNEEGYAWNLDGTQQALAKQRNQAFDAFFALDAELRGDLEGDANDAFSRGTVDKKSRAKMLDELTAHAKRLRRMRSVAVADDEEVEVRFLSEERAVVDDLIEGLTG